MTANLRIPLGMVAELGVGWVVTSFVVLTKPPFLVNNGLALPRGATAEGVLSMAVFARYLAQP